MLEIIHFLAGHYFEIDSRNSIFFSYFEYEIT